MIKIVNEDRSCISHAVRTKQAIKTQPLAVGHNSVRDNKCSLHEAQYPEPMTYDIILIQLSLLGHPGMFFQRFKNDDDDKFVCYKIPTSSDKPTACLEYLKMQDNQGSVREFVNVWHCTTRPSHQAVNPYLMVMNALQKLDYWYDKGMGEVDSVRDDVFMDAYGDCQVIMARISQKIGGDTSMSAGKSFCGDVTQTFIDAFSST